MTFNPTVSTVEPDAPEHEMENAVSSWETLAGFALRLGRVDGVAIPSLEAGSALTVGTRNSEYHIVVVDPARQVVLVRGGLLLADKTEACLQGASVGGCIVKVGWIGIGLRMELSVGRQRIVTSAVRSITIEG